MDNDPHADMDPRGKIINLLIGQRDTAMCPIEISVNRWIPLSDAVDTEISTQGCRLRRYIPGLKGPTNRHIVLLTDGTGLQGAFSVPDGRIIEAEKAVKQRLWGYSYQAKFPKRRFIVALFFICCGAGATDGYFFIRAPDSAAFQNG